MIEKKERIDTHQPLHVVLKQLREQARYTKTQFAKLLGVTKNHYGQFESGDCNLSTPKLVKAFAIHGYELTIRRIPKFPQNNAEATVVSSESAEGHEGEAEVE